MYDEPFIGLVLLAKACEIALIDSGDLTWALLQKEEIVKLGGLVFDG